MSEAFSAGLGIALGLVMGQCVFQAASPPEKVAAKIVLICQNCTVQKSIDNKFCGDCGQSLYPPPQIGCRNCGSKMSASMKYCGNCGSILNE